MEDYYFANPRVTLFSSSGKFNVSIGMFGNIQGRDSGVHKALDLFAQTGTKLYAPLDCEEFLKNTIIPMKQEV